MSTESSQQPASQTAQPTGTAPSQVAPGTTSPPTSPTAPSEPWRVPMTDPRVWARGKTAEEVLGVADTLNTTLDNFVRTGQTPQPTQPQYQQPQYQQPTQQQPPQLGSEDLVTGAHLQEWGQRAFTQQVAP